MKNYLKYKLRDINKTNKMKNNDNKETFNTPKEYIASLSDEKKKNMEFLLSKISEVLPNEKPFMMSGIIGFGKYHFKYASGREGDWLTIGLKENKTGYSIYICSIDKVTNKYLIDINSKKIGKASCGKSCIRFKKLEDIDLDFVLSLIKKGIKAPLFVDLNVKDRK